MKTIKTFYMNLKIRYKLLLGMISVTFVTIVLLTFGAYYFSYKVALQQATLEMEKSLTLMKDSLYNDINKLQLDITYLLDDSSVHKALDDILFNQSTNHVSNYIALNDSINNTIQGNDLIDSLAIISTKGDFYSTFDIGLNHSFDDGLLFDNISYTSQAWYSPIQNPLNPGKGYVIPIAFPVSSSYYSNYNFYVQNPEDLLAFIYVFIDLDRFNLYLSKMNKNTDSVALLFKGNEPISQLQPLDMNTASSMENPLPSVTASFIDNLHQTSSTTFHYKHETFLAIGEPIDILDLSIVTIISRTQLLAHLSNLKQLFYILSLVLLAVAVLLSYILSLSITRPLRQLMSLVSDIGNGNYRHSNSYDYNDEVGLLRKHLNQMSGIIDGQIQIIRQQEKDYREAEIDILAQQINPHFLYNTLDYIRWEIVNGNPSNSTKMVESLGQFLRLGLNRSSQTITIRNEIQRIKEYIAIINYRQTSNIHLETLVYDHLEDVQILNLILQPLIENCIKHGFSQEYHLAILKPTITLSFSLRSKLLVITVEDNGIGMDIPKMKSLIQNSKIDSPHVGIRNVYSRITMHYGDSSTMTFESLPFFKNSVTLILPLTD